MANHGQRGERLPGDWECRCGRFCYAARALCSVCSRHYNTRVGEVPLLPGQVKCANDGCREVVHADRQGDCLFCGRYTPVPAAPYRQHHRQQRAQQDPLAYWRGLSGFQQDEQFGRLERWIVRVLRALPAEDLHFGNRRGPVPYLLRTGGGLVHCLRLRQLESWFIGPQGEVERRLLRQTSNEGEPRVGFAGAPFDGVFELVLFELEAAYRDHVLRATQQGAQAAPAAPGPRGPCPGPGPDQQPKREPPVKAPPAHLFPQPPQPSFKPPPPHLRESTVRIEEVPPDADLQMAVRGDGRQTMEEVLWPRLVPPPPHAAQQRGPLVPVAKALPAGAGVPTSGATGQPPMGAPPHACDELQQTSGASPAETTGPQVPLEGACPAEAPQTSQLDQGAQMGDDQHLQHQQVWALPDAERPAALPGAAAAPQLLQQGQEQWASQPVEDAQVPSCLRTSWGAAGTGAAGTRASGSYPPSHGPAGGQGQQLARPRRPPSAEASVQTTPDDVPDLDQGEPHSGELLDLD
jgi:hypothetical protein